MLSTAQVQLVEELCERLSGLAEPWAVSGSLALAIQGVVIDCHDVDVVSTPGGALQIAHLFEPHVVEPVGWKSDGRLRGYFGRLMLRGCAVEVLGDIQNLRADGSWTNPPRLDQEVMRLGFGNSVCPVLALAYLRQVYEVMGRPDRVRLIAGRLQSCEPWSHGRT